MTGGAIAATSCGEISDTYSETADAALLLAARSSSVNHESLDRRTKLSIGGILYLTSNGLVAATVIVMCFGSGFLMLGSQSGGVLSRSGTPANLEAGSMVRNGFFGSDHSAEVASQGRATEASEMGRSAAALPSGDAISAEVESPAPHPFETAPLEPPAAATLLPPAVAPPSPTAATLLPSAAAAPPPPDAAAPPSPAAAAPPPPIVAAPSPPAATVPSSQAASGPIPGLSAAEIGELLEHGDSLLRTGDIVSARLFYERAAAAGDGHAALRVAATFDPDFLGRLGLGKVQADAAQARVWYSRAIELGAADAKRQLDKLSTGHGR